MQTQVVVLECLNDRRGVKGFATTHCLLSSTFASWGFQAYLAGAAFWTLVIYLTPNLNRPPPMASILLIDDDDIFRAMTADVLEQGRHEVTRAVNGKEGLELYGKNDFDVIITDIVMPDMDGLEMISLFRKSSHCPRIIAISGFSKFSHTVYLPAAKHFGALHTLDKPFRPEDLLSLVDRVLAEPNSENKPSDSPSSK